MKYDCSALFYFRFFFTAYVGACCAPILTAVWLVCSVLTLIYYSRVELAGKRVVDDPTSMPEKA